MCKWTFRIKNWRLLQLYIAHKTQLFLCWVGVCLGSRGCWKRHVGRGKLVLGAKISWFIAKFMMKISWTISRKNSHEQFCSCRQKLNIIKRFFGCESRTAGWHKTHWQWQDVNTTSYANEPKKYPYYLKLACWCK